MGLKSHDHLAMPLCPRCHRDFHDARGAFRDWDKTRRREWQAEQSKKYGPDAVGDTGEMGGMW